MSTILKWGLITGAVYLIFLLSSQLLGLSEMGAGAGILSGLLILILTFVPIFMGVKEVKEVDNDGYLTLSQGFVSGLKIALIASIIYFIGGLLYYYVINPGFMDVMMEKAEEQWANQNMTDEQIEQAKKWAGYMMNPFLFATMGLFSGVFWGLIKGLVAGLILKKDPPMTMYSATPPPPPPAV